MTNKKSKFVPRYKILPDKTFRKLWEASISTDNKKEYMNSILLTSSKCHIDFKKKYDIKYEQASLLLSEIYDKSHMCFAEIMELCNLRNRDVADIFCIPSRTIEDWKSGKSKCPAYIRLGILRHFHQINLGKYIQVESERKMRESYPAIYAPYKKQTDEKNQLPEKSPVIIKDYVNNLLEEDDEDLDNLTSIRLYDNKIGKYESVLSSSETRRPTVSELLSKTDYLKNIMK